MQSAPASSELGSPKTGAVTSSPKKRKREKGDTTERQPAKSNVRSSSSNSSSSSFQQQQVQQNGAARKLRGAAAAIGASASEWSEELEQSLVPTAEECSQLASVLKMQVASDRIA